MSSNKYRIWLDDESGVRQITTYKGLPLAVDLNGNVVCSLKTYTKYDVADIITINVLLLSLQKDKELIIEQYTGLIDKNGKEIYEGDIIKEIDKYIAEIIYKNGCFTYRFINNPEDWADIYYPIQDGENNAKRNSEVIGNIHENPELLKEEK